MPVGVSMAVGDMECLGVPSGYSGCWQKVAYLGYTIDQAAYDGVYSVAALAAARHCTRVNVVLVETASLKSGDLNVNCVAQLIA